MTATTQSSIETAQVAPIKRSSKRKWDDRFFSLFLVLPAIIAVIGVSVYPVGYAIWTSFHNKNPAMQLNQWVGLGNYRYVLNSQEFRDSISVTFRFAIASTILTIVLGLLIALVLNEAFKGRGLLRSLILVPWAMSGTVVGVLWAWIYDGGYGTLNGILYRLGFIDSYIAWFSAFELPLLGPAALYMVVIAYVWTSAPMAALFLLAAMQPIPESLYRAASMDGASAWQRFRYITLPWLKPMLLLVLLLSTINGIMHFDLIYFLTRGGPGTQTTVFSWLGYNTIFGFFQFGIGTTILLILTLICLILAFVYMKVLDRKPSDAADLTGRTEASVDELAADLARRTTVRAQELAALSSDSANREFALPDRVLANATTVKKWKSRLIYLPAVVIGIWSMAPVVWLFICSVSPFTDLLRKPVKFIPDVTLDNYRRIFTGATAADTAGVPLVAERVPDALMNSFIVASSVTLISLVLGSLAGYAYSRYSHVGFLGPTLIVMMMTRMVPGLAIMVPWFILFSRAGLSNTKTGLIISYASFSIPLVLWVMKTFFDTVPINLERAAAVDGCSRLQTLYRVVLPLAVPGLVAAGLFAFITSWNEFIFALNLAQDADSMTITYVIAQLFGVVLYGTQNYGTLFAAGILAILPPVALAFIFQRQLVQGLTAGSVKG